MKRVFCCLKPKTQGEASASGINRSGDDEESDAAHPFGDNEYLTYAWRHHIDLPDDRHPQDPSASSDPFSLPVLSRSGITFRWREIVDGTQNLRAENYLGRGSFGSVYRCALPRLNTVGAAKIQNPQNTESHREFVSEITALYAADHPNVIKLLGKCFGFDRSALVYAYMPKCSVERYIYGETRPGPLPPQKYPVLDWDTRMRIAVGVAEGLAYVHDVLKTIHRDVKLSNILLDEDFVPKLTDFGLAVRIVEDENGDEKQKKLYPIKGTPGCIAPETEQQAIVSTKTDVYSYGVLLFALFTGRKANDNTKPYYARKLTDWLVPVWSSEENMPLVIDVTLGRRFSVQGLTRLFQAARMCTDPQPLARPVMNHVKQMVREAAAYRVPEGPPPPLVMPRRSF